MIDAKAFGLELAGMVKAQLAPLVLRMEAIERRIEELPTARDGKDADMGQVRQIIGEELAGIRSAVSAIQPAPELPDIPGMIEEGVKAAVAAMPAPQDGKSVTVDDVAPLIASEVEKRIGELPKPKDGADGKDGVGMAGALIDRSGELVVTLSNGETKNLGPVVGRDGIDAKGEDGKDGLGFDDLDVTYDGEKTITLKFTKGERTKEFAFSMPVVIDRGVYREGNEYKAGDGVTWGGSFWIAQKDTSSKPDTGDDWRLSVKRGRDGKPGEVKPAKSSQPVRVGVPAKVE
jgi:hypothetical protein